LPIGGIIGIVVGGVVIFAIVAILFCVLRQRRHRDMPDLPGYQASQIEMAENARAEVTHPRFEPLHPPTELLAKANTSELLNPTTTNKSELPRTHISELPEDCTK
jgi:hypothetical protein